MEGDIKLAKSCNILFTNYTVFGNDPAKILRLINKLSIDQKWLNDYQECVVLLDEKTKSYDNVRYLIEHKGLDVYEAFFTDEWFRCSAYFKKILNFADLDDEMKIINHYLRDGLGKIDDNDSLSDDEIDSDCFDYIDFNNINKFTLHEFECNVRKLFNIVYSLRKQITEFDKENAHFNHYARYNTLVFNNINDTMNKLKDVYDVLFYHSNRLLEDLNLYQENKKDSGNTSTECLVDTFKDSTKYDFKKHLKDHEYLDFENSFKRLIFIIFAKDRLSKLYESYVNPFINYTKLN